MVRYGKRDKRVALYLRVSTGEQTTKNQRRELEAAAERHGWKVAAIFEDAGISGAKGRKDRPGLDAMLKAVARREVDMVMAWSVDRLGRSLVDLLTTLQELHAKEVDLYLHQQGSTPARRAGGPCSRCWACSPEFERSMIQERVKAGLARARDEGVTLGRPTLEDADPARAAKVRAMRARGIGIRKIARELGVGVGTVLRLTSRPGARLAEEQAEPEAQQARSDGHPGAFQARGMWRRMASASLSRCIYLFVYNCP